MCTLITFWQCHPSAPLIVALNRDEFLGRPTRSPEFWEETPPQAPVVAGRDLQAGGTWFGIGRHVVAGLTNHRRPDARRTLLIGELSRGDLVLEALSSPSASQVGESVADHPGERYGPFHLLACDAEEMRWITNRDGPMESHRVNPGIHVLGNLGLDNEDDPVVKTVKARLEGAESWGENELERRLRELLATHGAGNPCVHYSELYGTRSSALLWWGGNSDRYLITEGPPCKSPWQDRTPLLKMLGARKARPIS